MGRIFLSLAMEKAKIDDTFVENQNSVPIGQIEEFQRKRYSGPLGVSLGNRDQLALLRALLSDRTGCPKLGWWFQSHDVWGSRQERMCPPPRHPCSVLKRRLLRQ